MALKEVFIVALTLATTCVNAKPVGLDLVSPLVEIIATPKVNIGTAHEENHEIENSSLLEKRSIENDDGKLISNNEIDNDDLETAAGTNVLRPLFVYRQQVAYRERVRKAGRRAAPNF